jgi:phospholipid/cholesterol/gamma-HCH transport system substrate-binding protein
MRTRSAVYTRFLAMFAVFGVLGVGATVYLLVHQRVVLPFQSLYSVKARFAAANGVLAGTGQPVNVAGVKVGQVTGVELSDGSAVVTMTLERDKLPHVYQDAGATLTPITPLGDMSVDLNPGQPPAPPMRAGGVIGLRATRTPVSLSDVLSSLDADTRDYLTTLVSSLQTGLRGRGDDMRRMFRALSPTVDQMGRISRALADRRTKLASFVHDLVQVTHAASEDRQLSSFVVAGNRALEAMTAHEAALRATIAELPPTLRLTWRTLNDVRPFAEELGPSLRSFEPAVRRLPSVLPQAQRFANVAVPALRDQIRPMVRQAIPYFDALAPAITQLNASLPSTTGMLQTFNYLTNELAFVPGGDDQGFLKWIAWAAHNLDSGSTTGDANGSIGRGTALADCGGAEEDAVLQKIFGPNVCKR